MRRLRAPSIVFLAVVPSAFSATGVSGETETHTLPETRVIGARIEAETDKVPLDALRSGRFSNLGEALTDIPGVSGVKRSHSAVESVVRGLDWERVQTQVDGLPLHGACPGRMDPPVMILQPESVQEAYVVKGIPSVTLGPAGTGGRVMVSTDYERREGSPPEMGGWLRSTYDSARDGILGGIAGFGGTKRFAVYGSFAGASLDNYKSASGIEVPAGQKEFGGSLSLGYRPFPNHRVRFGFVDLEDRGIDYPSLPMNSDGTSSRVFSLAYRVGRTGNRFEGFRVRVGYENVDHKMNNEGKATRKKLRSETEADSGTFSTSLGGKWRPWSSATLTTGADFFHLNRDALRSRHIIAGNRTYLDHIWPDTLQWDVGAFAELDIEFTVACRPRGGGRFDFVSSDARAADGPGLEGRIAGRADFTGKVRWWGEFGCKLAAKQTKVDSDFPESETPGYAVFHLRGGFEVLRRLRIDLGIENLFDREYTEHLTPWAAVGAGDLKPGDEIPEPGRFVHAGFEYDF